MAIAFKAFERFVIATQVKISTPNDNFTENVVLLSDSNNASSLAKDVFNNPNDIEFQTLKKCINEVTVTTGDWERLTGQERDCME